MRAQFTAEDYRQVASRDQPELLDTWYQVPGVRVTANCELRWKACLCYQQERAIFLSWYISVKGRSIPDLV